MPTAGDSFLGVSLSIVFGISRREWAGRVEGMGGTQDRTQKKEEKALRCPGLLWSLVLSFFAL
jgi:hypothetical protein